MLPFPAIEPASEGEGSRPEVSVMIPTYNRTTYLEATLRSVLRQDWGPERMQIEVVDNCSPNPEVESLVRDVGRGRVAFFRKPTNTGMAGNWNTCIRRARGQWVHLLHDDDTVRENFYERLLREPDPDAADVRFCRTIEIDETDRWSALQEPLALRAGLLEDVPAILAVDNVIRTPAILVRRSTYEQHGGFLEHFQFSPDWEMWRRLALHVRFWYQPEPLACYRVHQNSDTSRLVQTGRNLAEVRECIELCAGYLPADRARQLSRAARRRAARAGLLMTSRLLARRRFRAAWCQLTESVKCSVAPTVVAGVALQLGALLASGAARSLDRGLGAR